MQTPASRRDFLKTTGAMSASTWLGTSSVGYASSASASAALSATQQYALTATQALAALQAKTMTAQAYVGNLIARGESLGHLNAMITWNKAAALACRPTS